MEEIVKNIATNTFYMTFFGSLFASLFHLKNKGSLLNPFKVDGTTSKDYYALILINIFVVSFLGVITTYVLYSPTDNEALKALFAGLSATMMINNGDFKAFKKEN